MTLNIGDVIETRDSEEESVSWACTIVTTPISESDLVIVDWHGRQPENSRALIRRHWVVHELPQLYRIWGIQIYFPTVKRRKVFKH